MITMQEAAARLDGNEYGNEGSRELWAEMKAAGLVAVFGMSDDGAAIEGATQDECGVYGGGKVYFTRRGQLDGACDDHRCPHYARARAKAVKVAAVWSPKDVDASWLFKMTSNIPHATFKIMDSGKVFCIGLVFSLADCPEV